jgi:5'-3' exonuclease
MSDYNVVKTKDGKLTDSFSQAVSDPLPEIALIDGDIIAYRAAFSTQDGLPEDALDKTDELIENILQDVFFNPDRADYEVFLTGKGNFRYDVDDTYKAHRKDTEKPIHLELIRNHLIDQYGANVSSGEEADDVIAIRATELYPNGVIVSVDKDFMQVPGIHFNPTKGEWVWVNDWAGLVFFYTQILTGDRADNVVGLHRVGPVKAAKILEGSESEYDMYHRCVEAYDGDTDKVIRNAKLLWLRREVGQVWQPPQEKEGDSESQP